MLLRNVKLFSDYTILAKDGEIGKMYDFLFDYITWTLRYLVVDTGHWLSGRRVLLSPEAVEQSLWESQQFAVNLTKAQIEESPGIDADKPVSLQQQIELHGYYVWPHYWAGPGFVPVYPPAIYDDIKRTQKSMQEDIEKGDPHLRSTKEVTGYRIQATDGEIGHVEDFLVNDERWKIHYMVVDTRNWLPGRKVLVAPTWITGVHWADRKVSVFLSQEAVTDSPEYFPNEPVSQEYENRLYDHYGLSK